MSSSGQPLTEIIKTLEGIGFSEREAGVYVALLELGRGTVSAVARKANINRTTGYDILDHLVSKGLASVSGKKPKQEYATESPDRIRTLFKEEVQKSESNFHEAENLIPQLKSLYSIGSRPQIRFYEGKDGVREVYEDTLTSKETIRAYANVDDMHKALPEYFPRYYKRRADKGIAIRAIIPANDAGVDRANHDSEEKRETVLVSSEKYYFSPEINVYDNKVMIASWREELGIIIESAEIADAMKKIYELAWRGAQEVRKETPSL